MRDMHFQDTHQVKREIEEAKKEYMNEKRRFEDVMQKKQEIYAGGSNFKGIQSVGGAMLAGPSTSGRRN